MNYTCNKCKTLLKQHHFNKEYFYCEKCELWYKCWLPMSENKIKKAIEKAKMKGYY